MRAIVSFMELAERGSMGRVRVHADEATSTCLAWALFSTRILQTGTPRNDGNAALRQKQHYAAHPDQGTESVGNE